MVDYWALRLGEGGKYVRQGHKGNFVAVGWSRIGDLSWLADAKVDSENLADQMTHQYVKAFGSNLSKSQVVVGVGQLVRFARDMKKGDIVLVPDTERHKFLVGKITSDYQFKEKWGDDCDYPHRRTVEWLKEVDRAEISEKLRNSLGAIMTVWSLQRHAPEIEQILTGVRRVGVRARVTGNELLTTVVERLGEMSWKDFQDMVAHLLGIVGFEATTTQYVGDKGVDVIGILNAEGIANVTLRVQVKRVHGNLGIEEVQRIRGTLEKNEHGAIVTAGGFTKQAEEEAQAANKVPISLIDGERLAELLLTHFDDIDETYKDILHVRKVEVPVSERFVTELEKN